MRVTVFTKYGRRGPSSRYRYYQFQPYLRAAGIQPTCRPLLEDHYFKLKERVASRWAIGAFALGHYVRRLGTLVRGDLGQGLVLEHQLFPYLPAWVEHRLLKRLPYTLEFDDAVYLTAGHHPKIGTLCSRARAVVVGNAELAAYAKRFADRVEIVPTVIDTARYPPRPEPCAGDICG